MLFYNSSSLKNIILVVLFGFLHFALEANSDYLLNCENPTKFESSISKSLPFTNSTEFVCDDLEIENNELLYFPQQESHYLINIFSTFFPKTLYNSITTAKLIQNHLLSLPPPNLT